MKISKALIIALPFVFFSTILYAQFGMPKYGEVSDMKNRQLVVIVNPPNPDIINKFDRKSKPEVVQNYEQVIGEYNDVMKYAAQNFWTFNSKEILFKTRAELNAMLSDKGQRDNYVVMCCFSFETGYKRDFDWKIDGKGKTILGTKTIFAIGAPGELPFYQVYFKELIPSEKFIVYCVSNTNYKFNYMMNHKDNYDIQKMVDRNGYFLAGKTLLVLKDDVSPKVIDNIHSDYPCNFRLVNDSEMLHAVASGDSTCAYVIHSEGSYGRNANALHSQDMNWIINCADGAPLGYSKKGLLLIAFTTDQGLRDDFFKDIAGYCNEGKKK